MRRRKEEERGRRKESEGEEEQGGRMLEKVWNNRVRAQSPGGERISEEYNAKRGSEPSKSITVLHRFVIKC